MTRKEIDELMEANAAKIIELKKQNQQLYFESMLLCDEVQWFVETEEDVVVSRRPKKIEKKKIGRVHWKEHFKDEDTGETITIERTQTVRVNGEWWL